MLSCKHVSVTVKSYGLRTKLFSVTFFFAEVPTFKFSGVFENPFLITAPKASHRLKQRLTHHLLTIKFWPSLTSCVPWSCKVIYLELIINLQNPFVTLLVFTCNFAQRLAHFLENKEGKCTVIEKFVFLSFRLYLRACIFMFHLGTPARDANGASPWRGHS